MTSSITAIILTFNEEKHIARCINSLNELVERVVIIDSFSSDDTVSISKSMGADVYQNKWPGFHSSQFNWGMSECMPTSKWLIRLDADEFLTSKLKTEIQKNLDNSNNIDGYFLKRGHIFLNKKIMYGGSYPVKLLRIWKNGLGRCENKLMDEHITLDQKSKTKVLNNDFWDHNLNSITWWIDKHNDYATKEAIQISLYLDEIKNTKTKLKIKQKILYYYKLPIFIRPLFYFTYRYFLRLGFLDGLRGFLWHFLQAFWYRVLVDIKIYEFKKKSTELGVPIKSLIAKDEAIKHLLIKESI
jgi:glycosyltransferase involved in cell wall biosynthesis